MTNPASVRLDLGDVSSWSLSPRPACSFHHSINKLYWRFASPEAILI